MTQLNLATRLLTTFSILLLAGSFPGCTHRVNRHHGAECSHAGCPVPHGEVGSTESESGDLTAHHAAHAPPTPPTSTTHSTQSTPSDHRQQSPIDLPPAPPTSSAHHNVELRYHDTAEHLIHRDHTIELEFDPGSELEFDGRRYRLDQLHFHTPSEHLVAHQRFPVELHFVHRDADDRLLVLGVLFDVGAANPFVERILADAPRDLGRIDLERHLDVSSIFPKEQHFYAYEGSLTTAPYNENVQWLVLSEHPSISPEQVVRLLVMEGGNARDVQPVNDRRIDDG